MKCKVRVYLDANATTRTHPEVIKAMQPFYDRNYGNASSLHAFGNEARKAVEWARGKIGELIQADSSGKIIFTSGGTESDNLAIKGTAFALKNKGDHIITSSIEHPAVLKTCEYLERQGFRVTYTGVDKYGIVNMKELKDKITDDTILISVMSANNETGAIMPVEEIGELAAGKGIVFHTDAVQSVGKMPFGVKNGKIGMVSISAHKFNGPKGVGALYIKKGISLVPAHHGGHHEYGLRAGTENVPGIAGFGKACEIAVKYGEKNWIKIQRLRDLLQKRIQEEIENISLNGHPEKRLPNTLNVSFRGVEGESVVLNLDIEGIAVSTGSACASGSLEPSHVLKSMGIDRVTSQGAVRFSLDSFNTEDEIEYVMAKLPSIVKRLRNISPM